ncbi:cell division protein [Actinobacillus equuli]|nr:cell division protein [Actinobacillus equuli]
MDYSPNSFAYRRARKLVQQNRKLENQYIHLQLEENAKSQKSRVEAAAASFGLQQIKKEQEVIWLNK